MYVNDVARLVTDLVESTKGTGDAINISYGSSITLTAFLEMLAEAAETDAQVVAVERSKLEAAGLLPDCSPFSGKWMSEVDNSHSLEQFDTHYTSPVSYIPSIV